MRLILSAILVLGLATALSAQEPSGTETSKILTNFDDEKPVFKLRSEQLANTNRFLHFFAFTGYREGVLPILGQFNSNFKAQVDKVHGTHRIKMYNLSITDMLTYGLTKSSEVILEVKDPSKFRFSPEYGNEKDWLRKNGYCYELLIPQGTLKTMDMVRNHLSQLFKVKCGYQKRPVKVLRNTDGMIKDEMKEMDVFVITEIN